MRSSRTWVGTNRTSNSEKKLFVVAYIPLTNRICYYYKNTCFCQPIHGPSWHSLEISRPEQVDYAARIDFPGRLGQLSAIYSHSARGTEEELILLSDILPMYRKKHTHQQTPDFYEGMPCMIIGSGEVYLWQCKYPPAVIFAKVH